MKDHRVKVTGNLQSNRTLIFIHGFGSRQEVWHSLIEPLISDFRIVLLDSIGSNSSAAVYRNLYDYAEDFVDICSALEIKNAVLVGHSAGAMIGLVAANISPQIASRLILIGASPRYLDDPDSGYKGGFSESDIDEIYKSVVTQFSNWTCQFANSVLMAPDQPELSADFVNNLRALPISQVLTVLYSIFQSDHRQELTAVIQPTLIVQSKQDIVVPHEVANYLKQQIPKAELVEIDVPGHCPHLTAPSEVRRAIQKFIYQD